MDTRTAPSQSTDEPGADNSSREAREILTAILTAFHDNLKTAVASTWTRWLKSYIEDLVKHELRQPMLATLKWKENYIKARADGFWDLDWHEKVSILPVPARCFPSKSKTIVIFPLFRARRVTLNILLFIFHFDLARYTCFEYWSTISLLIPLKSSQ